MRAREIRSLFQGRIREAHDAGREYRSGCSAFLRDWNEALGLNPAWDGERGDSCYLTEELRPTFGEGRFSPKEVSIATLCEAIVGRDARDEFYGPSSSFSMATLREAAIDPTAFLNINLFNLATAGLVNARMLEGFNKPEYIGRGLVTVVPTNMNGHKIIGTTGIAPQTVAAKNRAPGQSHATVAFGEAWQTTPETVEQALKVEITKEATFFEHISGDVMRQADTVGDELAYGEEKEICDEFIGATNSYNRSGTSNNTYQDTSPWINDHANEFSDENDLDDANALLLGLTDPDTGREIQINLLQVFCSPYRERVFREQLFPSQVSLGTQISSSVATRIIQSQSATSQVMRGTIKVIPLTQIWHNRMIAADGLALSAANAKKYWWVGEPQRAFEWHENWPMTPWQAMATELVMKDRGLISVHGVNKRGKVYTREPRYMVRNKNA
jgi:hypothetical protein